MQKELKRQQKCKKTRIWWPKCTRAYWRTLNIIYQGHNWNKVKIQGPKCIRLMVKPLFWGQKILPPLYNFRAIYGGILENFLGMLLCYLDIVRPLSLSSFNPYFTHILDRNGTRTRHKEEGKNQEKWNDFEDKSRPSHCNFNNPTKIRVLFLILYFIHYFLQIAMYFYKFSIFIIYTKWAKFFVFGFMM